MGDHDAPGNFILCNLVHKGRNQYGGDTGDRSILCWQLYNFLLEKEKNKCTQEAATTGRVATPQEKRQCLSLKVPAGPTSSGPQTTWSPQHSWT